MVLKGQFEQFGSTVIFLLVLLVLVVVGIFLVLFAHGKSTEFEFRYTDLTVKPFSVSEAVIRARVDKDRDVMDHLLVASITGESAGTKGEKKFLVQTNYVDVMKNFLDMYGFNYYSLRLEKNGELIEKIENVPKFCGKLDDDGNVEKTCEVDGKTTLCMAYCEESCSKGRVRYNSGDDKCSGNEVCCIEKYDWNQEQYYNLYSGPIRTSGGYVKEVSCLGGSGICDKHCATGRKLEAGIGGENNKFCQDKVNEYLKTINSNTNPIDWVGDVVLGPSLREVCCVPLRFKEFTGLEGTADSVIPVFYKKTKYDNDGVVGLSLIHI